MGQYWMVVNLDKREYVVPHRLGAGLKLCEQVGTHPGTGAALIVLLAAMPETRGGGDLDLENNWHGPERTFPEHNIKPGPMPEAYPAIAKRTIGRWAGDRVALVGDYAERGDLPRPEDNADLIYDLCHTEAEKQENVAHYRKVAAESPVHAAHCAEQADRLEALPVFTDVSDDVCAVIEHELGGKFEGTGWREWKENATV